MCVSQSCVSVSSLDGVGPCPIGSNGQTCSGNGVRALTLALSHAIIAKIAIHVHSGFPTKHTNGMLHKLYMQL